jgi:hypothetical protein
MRQLIKFALALSIIAVPVGLLGQRGGREPRVSPPEAQGAGHSKKPPVSVPEPSTLLLMGAAGALAATKLWRKRQ